MLEEKMLVLRIVALVAGLVVASFGTVAAAGDAVPRVAFYGFQLINTSLEPTKEVEKQRIRDLDDLFRTKLDESGRFTIVAIPVDVREEIDGGPGIGNCNGCERDYTKRIGAELAAWGTVQKVSNLILNINVYMEDVETGQLTFVKSVDIRGNTDESWHRGLSYLLRHYLFQEP